MSKNLREEEQERIELTQSQVLNNVKFASMILGVEFRAGLVYKHGVLMPALKVRRFKRSSKDDIDAARVIYMEAREKYCKVHKKELTQLSDKYITLWHRFFAKLMPTRVLWDVYWKIEQEHEAGFRPIVVYEQNAIYAHAQVVEKKARKPIVDNAKSS